MLNRYFEAKKKIYPQNVKGRFRQLKTKLNFVFLSIYLLLPLVRFNRGEGAPDQGVLIDLPNSKAYFFFIEIWPQEVFYLMGVLVIAAVMLFFVTSLFGRIWCGYACFQTVWTDIFIGLERFFQGDRNERILLDRKNNFKKFYKKFLTHSSWIIASLVTGYGFVGYFNDSFLLAQKLVHGVISWNVLGWICGIAGTTYIMAGFAREHVCTYMCPYSRFQSAMFDKNTLIITYDEKRGEARGKLPKGEHDTAVVTKGTSKKPGCSEVPKDLFLNRGHCIDCKQCVVVCPVGIDIRNGLQMECIACGLCVDACDNVMEKIGLPKGLIRYDTLDHLLDPIPNKKFKILKPRTLFYSIILTLSIALTIRSLIVKPKFETVIIPDRNPIFVTLSDGSIRNGYVIKVTNKTHEKRSFILAISSPKEAVMKSGDSPQIAGGSQRLEISAGEVGSFKIYVILPKEFIARSAEGRWLMDFILMDENGNEVEALQTVFIGSVS